MKVAHIISHTHWDREWYMPYESHHMRLIMLIDQVLEAIDNDPDFKSFHLDGQTICVDDYLQVKPQNREKLLTAIKDGKIKIGPWYILQDAFLTSTEANVRNGYYGNIDCMRYGSKTSVGYYPDTFGIYSQAPQILRELEVDNMIFGRGVSTTGFNNEVSNDFESKFSEMQVTSSDGTSVLGILFANWYSNGNEIPVDIKEAKVYWEQKLADCMKYTDCDNLLFMNGCDHTPYQSDVTAAIKVSNELFPDIEFKQSSFDEYLSSVKAEIKDKQLTNISGELTSQTTDGYYTLVNTASSRINQKIANANIQDKYQYLVEPLSALYSENYMHSELEYGWKKLMQNHPHDSICGCSVDSVHNTIDSRFEDSDNVANHIISTTLTKLSESITNDDELAFTVFNPSELSNTNHHVVIEYRREEFGPNFRAARDRMKEVEIPNLILIDSDGNEIAANFTDLGIGFDYYLPDEKFRRPYYSRNIAIDFSYKFDYIGHTTFYIKQGNSEFSCMQTENILENDNLKITINDNGSVTMYNKVTKQSQTNIIEIYDEGDIGNEYMFGPVKNDKNIFLSKIDKIDNLNDNGCKRVIASATLTLPTSADETLQEEQLDIVSYPSRNAKRSQSVANLPLMIEYTLGKYDKGLNVNIKIANNVKDHRMRTMFKLDNSFDHHYADSAFETVKRNNKPMETWKNPSFDHRLAKFVKLQNEADSLIIGTNGLHEYEMIDNNVAITLIRSVGELGDWGHFPTPQAQCLYEVNAQLYIIFDSKQNDNINQNICRSIFVKQPFVQLEQANGKLAAKQKMINVAHDANSYISTIKRSLDNELVIRFGSNGDVSKIIADETLVKTNMLEQAESALNEYVVKANEILTVKVKND